MARRYGVINKNNSGFTLVELMIVVALLGGLSMVVMQITKDMNKTSLKAQADADIILATNEIVSILSNPRSCAATFGATFYEDGTTNTGTLTRTIAAGTITKIVHKPSVTSTAQDKYVVDAKFGTTNEVVKSYSLAPGVSGDSAILTVTFEKKAMLNGGSAGTLARKINLYVELNGSNIKACRSLSTFDLDIWTRAATQNDIFYQLGNVGIGTDTPINTLHVDTTTSLDGILLKGAQTVGNTVTTALRANLVAGSYNGITQTGDHGLIYSGTALGNAKGFVIAPWGAGTSGIRMDSAGNVGIGTTNPSATLEVTGTIRQSSSTGYGYGGAYGTSWIGTTTSAWAQPYLHIGGETSGGVRRVGIFADQTHLSGKVGIGTMSPSSPLHVNGWAPSGEGLRLSPGSGTEGGQMSLMDGTGAGGWEIDNVGTGAGADLRFFRDKGVNNVTAMSISSAGNVGIGTPPNVSYKLDVNGNINVTSGNAITIQGQPLTDLGTAAIAAQVPTKAWVQAQMADMFNNTGTSTLASISSSIANYTASNTMSVIKNTVCSNSKVIVSGTDKLGSYNSITGVCSYDLGNLPPDCTVPGNCNASSGANSKTLHSWIVYASLVGATTFTGGIANNAATGFCGIGGTAGGCITKTTKGMCSNNGALAKGYVQGIVNGQIICGRTDNFNTWSAN